MLDAYPVPRIEDVIAKASENEVFSTIDLKNAYHQVPILKSERKYTAFEANGKLYQFLFYINSLRAYKWSSLFSKSNG